MSRHFTILLRLLYCTAGLNAVLFTIALATPQNNPFDSSPMHTIRGNDKYYCNDTKPRAKFSVAPFYVHTRTASRKSESGNKVPASNIYGPYTMVGIFFNPIINTTGNTAYTNYNKAKTDIQAFPTIATAPGSTIATSPFNHDLTNLATYNPSIDTIGSYDQINLILEKTGFRSQFSWEFGGGISFIGKFGIADIKQGNAEFINTLLSDTVGSSTINQNQANATTLYNDLMGQEGRNKVMSELGIDMSNFRKVDLEDAHVSLCWQLPFPMKEKGELVANLVPLISLGAWLPLSASRDQNKAFSLPNGNDGFAAVTAEAALALDFPDILQLSVGGGIILSENKKIGAYRVPTNSYQIGVIPWINSIKKQPGTLWYLNISMKAENFVSKKEIPNFSFYFDYTYLEHLKDSITVTGPNPELFEPKILENRSVFKKQMLFAGIDYAITSNLSIGFGAQGTLGGSNCYRPTSIVGSLELTF